MLVVLLVSVLLQSAKLTCASGTAIPITLYTDNACDTPSTTAANISLEIGVCVVTPGLGSFDLQPFPCSSGDVAQYVFADTACGQAIWNGDYEGGTDGHCYAPISGDLAAIMLSCDQTSAGLPTATTTISVGPIATGGSLTSAASSSLPTTDSGGDGDGSSSSISSSTSPASGWNSLDLGTRIGIIVTLAVGIPPILLTIYMLVQKRKKQQRKAQQEAQAYGVPMPTPLHLYGGSNGPFQSRPDPSQHGQMRQAPWDHNKWVH